MALQLTNTATGKKEPFVPLGKTVTMYSCGPTVYNVAHIGNLASFVAADVLKRWLTASGFPVQHVMNVTDVDDKTIRGAQAAELPLSTFTQAHEARFIVDLERLNIQMPTIVRATEHIDEMVRDILILQAKGVAYTESGSTYFSVDKDPHYGDIAHLTARPAAAAKHRIDADEYEKDAVEDFVLWKAWKPEDGDVFWETELGKGRPGWHIECSAMIRRYLGEQIDIHTGGADLLFPHHTNETAQAECASGKRPFVRTWIHRAFLTVNDEKMAKRLGNTFSLADVAPTDLLALAFRFLLVASHYRTPLNFNDQSMPSACAAYGRLLQFWDGLEERVNKQAAGDGVPAALNAARIAFRAAMDDDLNTPQAVAAVFDLVGAVDPHRLSVEAATAVLAFLREDVDAVFGVLEKGLPLFRVGRTISEEETRQLQEMDSLRAAKDFAAADAIRHRLQAAGVEVRTTPEGSVGARNPFA